MALYVMVYTVGRGWIETLRIDTVEYNHVLGLRLNVWTSIVLFVLAAGVLRRRRTPLVPVARPRSTPRTVSPPTARWPPPPAPGSGEPATVQSADSVAESPPGDAESGRTKD